MINRTIKLLQKEALVSFGGEKNLLNALLPAFLTSLLSSYFINSFQIEIEATSILYWIILTCSGLLSLDRIFYKESQDNTLSLLLLHFTAKEILTSKYIFNLIIFYSIQLCSLFVFYIFTPGIIPTPYLLLLIFLSGLAFTSALILNGIISSKSSNRNLFFIISIPMILPILIVSVKLTGNILSGIIPNPKYFIFFVFYSLLFIILTYILGPIILKEES